MRTIRVCAGIGDNIWLIQKLVNSGERFRFKIAGDMPQRGKQIFDLTTGIVENAAYDTGFGSADAIKWAVQHKLWSEVKEEDFYLTANTHLEKGRNLTEYFPDLPTTYKVPWAVEEKDALEAAALLPTGVRYVGLYGSCYSVLRHWAFWDVARWAAVARAVAALAPQVTFVVVGAEFDIDLGRDLCGALAANGLKHVALLGRPLGVVIEAMGRLAYFFSFPSGLGPLAVSVGCPTMMFYPRHLIAMIDAWAPPAAIAARDYKGLLFCEPAEAIKCAVGECGLAGRLA